MELSNRDKIRTFGENETYKYLDILETDAITQVEMKDKIKKEYLRTIRKLTKTKLSRWNLIKRIIPGMYSSLNIRKPLWSGSEKDLSKWTKYKGN